MRVAGWSRLTVLFAAVAAALSASRGAPPATSGPVFYVAPDGKASADGSIGAPWDLTTALSGPPSVVAGSTIWLRGGTYSGRPGEPYAFWTALAGAPASPITVAGYPGERATLDAAGSRVAALCIGGNGRSASDLVFRDFEVTATRPSGADKPSGLWIRDSTRLVFANLVVHDLPGQGIGFWIENTDSAVSGCLVYYNGSSSLDHGIYAGNEGPKRKVIRDNLFLYNYGYGIHVYGSGPRGVINDFLVAGNIAAQNGRLVDTGSRRSPNGCNILVGGDAPGDSDVVADNATYWAPWAPDAAWKDDAQAVGYAAPLTNLTVTGNYFVGETLFRGIGSMTMKGNTFVRGTRGLNRSDHPSNDYRRSETGVRVVIRPNAWEKGRANLAVYNWARRKTVPVDLSAVVPPGARYEVRNAFDVYAPPVASGTFRGAPVSIPMTGLSIATPRAFPAPPSVAPEFGAFIVRSLESGVSRR